MIPENVNYISWAVVATEEVVGSYWQLQTYSGEKNTGEELETKKKEKLENDSNYGSKIEVENRA